MTPPTDPVAGIAFQEICAADIEDLAGQYPILFEDTAWHAAAIARSLAAPGNFAFLALSAGRAAGLILARVAADESEILWLVVPATGRRQGIGRRLLRAALNTAAGRGATTAYLEVSESNGPALALYDSEGFRSCGRRRAYYDKGRRGEARDALLYKKELTGDESCRGHRTVNRVNIVQIA